MPSNLSDAAICCQSLMACAANRIKCYCKIHSDSIRRAPSACSNKKQPGNNLTVLIERETGIEPATPTLARWCSTAEPLAHVLGYLPYLTTKEIIQEPPDAVNTFSQFSAINLHNFSGVLLSLSSQVFSVPLRTAACAFLLFCYLFFVLFRSIPALRSRCVLHFPGVLRPMDNCAQNIVAAVK